MSKFKDDFTIAIEIKVYEGQSEEKLLATYNSSIFDDTTLLAIMDKVENSLTDSEIAHLEGKAVNSEYDQMDYETAMELQAYSNTIWGDAEDDKRGGI